MKFRPAFFALVLLAVRAGAADSAYDLYAAGKYQEAMRAGSAANDGVGLTLAARAALADAASRAAPCPDCLARAEAYARAAIAADPRRPDAHTFLAITIGERARLKGLVLARLHNDPARARSELDAALALEPHNVMAQAALGGWNVEIVRAGGAHLAHWLYGASLQAGLDDFAQALRRDPGNVALHYQYALALSGLDPGTYRGLIQSALQSAVADTPHTAYEKIAQSRSAELLDILHHGDKAAFAARVRKFQGYP
jgi:hypothetical protein